MSVSFSRLRRRARGVSHVALARFGSAVLPVHLVNEYPKSGGTWLAQMLAEALGLPFPRNRMALPRATMLHGHFLAPYGLRRVVVLWRDGRDVLLSWYHHCLFENDVENALLVRIMRAQLQFENYDDVRANLPAFLEYSFTRQLTPAFSWSEFADVWAPRRDVVHAHYEALRQDTPGELTRIVRALSGRELPAQRAQEIADRYAFKAQRSGTRSFVRKGLVGDWHNWYSSEARAVFERHAGKSLIDLGYEPDATWVSAQAGAV